MTFKISEAEYFDVERCLLGNMNLRMLQIRSDYGCDFRCFSGTTAVVYDRS